MELIKKGTKLEEKWEGECRNCGNVYRELRTKLNIQSDRDGSLAEGKCPECQSQIWFYPIATTHSTSWADQRDGR